MRLCPLVVDPNATPEQRSILAQRAINHADWARLQLDEIRSPGAQREIGEAQRVLDGISEELKPWTAIDTVPQMIDPVSTTDTSFTNAYGYGTMQASGRVGDTDGYSSITGVRALSTNDQTTVNRELNGFGKIFQTADAEHSLVISLSGEVFEVTGSGGVVNTELVGADALEGSTVIHNHPIWEGYDKGDSFSEQDIIFAARNKAGMQYLISGTRRDAFIYTGSQDEYAIRRAYEKAKREVLEKAFDADMPIEFRQEAIMRVLGKYLEGFTFYEDLRF